MYQNDFLQHKKTYRHGAIQMVDLGLSVKWASCNIGANRPEEYGDYFAWGETETKQEFSWSNYRFCSYDEKRGTKTLLKYNNSSNNGTVENKTVLDLDDDIAHQVLGGTWRMPTVKEFNELKYHCLWNWTKIREIYGFKIYREEKEFSDRYIFLPAAGFIDNNILNSAGSFGAYWSKSLEQNYPIGAYYLYLNQEKLGITDYYRRCGQSIRPVCQ